MLQAEVVLTLLVVHGVVVHTVGSTRHGRHRVEGRHGIVKPLVSGSASGDRGGWTRASQASQSGEAICSVERWKRVGKGPKLSW